MSEERYLTSLKESILNLDYTGVVKAAEEAMEAGIDPLRAITDGMAPGMSIVGKKFETGEYFLSELVVAGDVMREGLKIINPYIKEDDAKQREKMVIATVEGDMHDIGKSIVATLLMARGFEVVDLGVDIPAEKIVDAVREHKPAILGLSALLTVTMPKMGEVIEALRGVGLREEVRVIIGGSSVTAKFAKSIGADHSSNNAVEGVEKCAEWVKEGR
jgi:corrinoid protein of di/trimethylamine methyltransferase